MAIAIIDGCKVYINGKKSIIINSDCIAKCMKVYKENNLDGVSITIFHDYKLHNVDFLTDYPEIKHLSLSEGVNDINGIYALGKLESAIISGKNRKIDFLHFPLLRNFSADWSLHFPNIDSCKNLRSLSFYQYNPKSKDCVGISNVPWVKKLRITQSPILTLIGLGEFDQLEELEFN